MATQVLISVNILDTETGKAAVCAKRRRSFTGPVNGMSLHHLLIGASNLRGNELCVF